MIENLKRKDELDFFFKNKDDNSVTKSEQDVNNNYVDKDFIIKNNFIKNENNDDISSVELSFNSGSMETISKKNFIPKIDLIQNKQKNPTILHSNNLKRSPCVLTNDFEEVKILLILLISLLLNLFFIQNKLKKNFLNQNKRPPFALKNPILN